MRLVLPLNWRFWQALLMCPLLLIFLGMERHAAWMDIHAERAQAALDAGLHPILFDFSDRSQLIGAKAEGAALTLAPGGGFWVQPNAVHLSFSLALGQPLLPADVTSVQLDIVAPPPGLKFALVLQEAAMQSAEQPAWISPLVDVSAGKLALKELQFTRADSDFARANTPSVTSRTWQSLPATQFLRLYVYAPSAAPFLLKSLSFTANPGAQAQLQSQIQRAEFAHFGALAPAGLVGMLVIWLLSLIPVWRGLLAGNPSAPFGLSLLVFLPGFVLLSWVWGFSVPGPFDTDVKDALADLSASLSNMRFSAVFLAQLLGITWLLGAFVLAVRYAALTVPISADLPAAAQNRLVLLGAMAGATIIIVAAGLPTTLPSPGRLLGYLGFALIQQFLLQRVLLRALLGSFSQNFAVLLAALMFALWHSPNITLMLACFFSAIYACALSIRGVDWRRLALLHALLGTLLVLCFPASALKNAEIGSRHFTLAASVR